MTKHSLKLENIRVMIVLIISSLTKLFNKMAKPSPLIRATMSVLLVNDCKRLDTFINSSSPGYFLVLMSVLSSMVYLYGLQRL